MIRLFKKEKTGAVPPECLGMDVKIESSVCTGEKTIGFYDRNTQRLKYEELVKSEKDIETFCKKYGIKREDVKKA